MSIEATWRRVREAFDSGHTRSIEWRKKQINAVIRLVEENREALGEALKKDLGVNEFMVHAVELEAVLAEAREALENIDDWIKPESVGSPVLALPAKSMIVKEPYGMVLIISPWNYPISLVLNPLIAAVSAGNAVVIKPSEVSVNTSKLLAQLIPKYADPVAVGIVEGAVDETTQLLKLAFDLIMYTGNTQVGRIVMRAAAEHLTPVLLELGGKCPAIIAPDADLKKTARRLVWGKWSLNNGQTCVAPDYILTTPDREKAVIEELKTTIVDFYGAKPAESKDISRMINERHAKRVVDLLDDKKIEVVWGGQTDGKTFIAPTLVRCGPDAKLMKDEIFGPVLPVLTVPNVDKAIEFINAREKPLALYVFSESKQVADQVLSRTSSGGACVNDIAMHVANPKLPFGGVGPSGLGAYHGRHGFESFSHKKAVFIKMGSDPSLRFPPYTASKLLWLSRLRSLNLGKLKKPLLFGVFVALLATLYKFAR